MMPDISTCIPILLTVRLRMPAIASTVNMYADGEKMRMWTIVCDN